MGDTKTKAELEEQVEELEDIIKNVERVALRSGRVEVEHVTYGDVTLHLDASGNVSSIDFGATGWEVS